MRVQWLERNGPFGVVIDGANVALFGQNWAQGGFSFDQINEAYKQAAAAYPDRKPLVVCPKPSRPRQFVQINMWRTRPRG